ncbi:hypothetical protein RRG08_003736 [Elysia crispata]|uniref:Uncharacterized protein n=1 Tax=Elysia crispata TaxID=231223 RepID=A0AAE1AVA9_9GAST|nr:hypothetical protein RRG08_003736 [Elysia crispata]
MTLKSKHDSNNVTRLTKDEIFICISYKLSSEFSFGIFFGYVQVPHSCFQNRLNKSQEFNSLRVSSPLVHGHPLDPSLGICPTGTKEEASSKRNRR